MLLAVVACFRNYWLGGTCFLLLKKAKRSHLNQSGGHQWMVSTHNANATKCKSPFNCFPSHDFIGSKWPGGGWCNKMSFIF